MVRHAAQLWGPATQCKAQCNHPGQVDSPLCVSVSYSETVVHICTVGGWLQGRCTKPTMQKSGDRGLPGLL